jgi:hypothetical protein
MASSMRQPINSKIDPLMVDFTLVRSALPLATVGTQEWCRIVGT